MHAPRFSRFRRARRAGGFTLLEIMVSCAILLVAVIGFYGVFGGANQLAYASRMNTSARLKLEAALAVALTEPWRSEQIALNQVPLVFQVAPDWVDYVLPGETQTGTTNASLLIDARRDIANPVPVAVARGRLQRRVTVDPNFPDRGLRISFQLLYGGPDAPLGLRTAKPVVMTVHTYRTRDN